MNKIFVIIIMFLILFASCRKESVTPDITVTPAMARDSLYYIMNDWYYWYEQMPNVNRENYDDPYLMLEALRYKPIDRWSFVADYDKFIAESNGIFVGHGFRISVDDSGNARIALIYDKSPLYNYGVRRGWIVKKINGIDPGPILLAHDFIGYTNMIGPSESGITNIFVFQRPDNTEVTISSTKSVFQINPVLLYDTLHLSTGITGQIVFESFFPPAEEKLAEAFAFFKANNIKDLILDLRYNSGGYLDIAQLLSSYIAGDSFQGQTFATVSHNDKHQDNNFTFPYITTSYSLALSRIAVITSRATASASEDVINGLKPFVNVVCIGDTTDGKPTGMYAWYVNKKYAILPVTFKLVNAEDNGDFFDGIFPEKVISDDITHDFNEREEKCLEEAIHYLETGSVSTKSQPVFKRYPQFSEKPEWMNNTFLN